MNIELPEKFDYTTKSSRGRAYVEKGILHIDGSVNFENLMYQLTYALYPEGVCGYCSCALGSKNRTIDHKFPRAYGGVSITNNLIPSCRKCNHDEKNAMTEGQYNYWKKLKTQKARNNYYKRAIKRNEEILKSGKPLLPKNWLVDYDIRDLAQPPQLIEDRKKTKEYKRTKLFYEEHTSYQYPIIISKNNILLDGRQIYFHAMDQEICVVYALVLENVIARFKR